MYWRLAVAAYPTAVGPPQSACYNECNPPKRGEQSASGLFMLIDAAIAAMNNTIKPIGLRFDAAQLVQWRRENAVLRKNFTTSDASCAADWTHRMPTCYQICSEWCWATVTTMAVDYYKGQNYCQGGECQVASWEHGNCCPWSVSCSNSPDDPPNQCNQGGTPANEVDALEHFTGGTFASYGPLSQATLDAALNSGRPVIIGVNWVGSSGGHALIVGGCGGGYYYLHDPWGWYPQDPGVPEPPAWQGLTYGQLLRYVPPGTKQVGEWVNSVMWRLATDTNDEAEGLHAKAVEAAERQRATINGRIDHSGTSTAGSTSGTSPPRRSIHEHVNQHIIQSTSTAPAQTLSQPLDHFAPLDTRRWAMRYWVDERFYAAGGRPDRVFLSMGGEGSSGPPGGMQSSFAQELFARDGHGALLCSIEHRYYGASLPTGSNFSTAALRYLGTAQALADAAAFRHHLTAKLHLSPDAQWVTVGGSYSGELAAWARLKYPNLFHAALSSSAPVSASIDFWGYDPIVAAALADPYIGGSAPCHDLVGAAFDSLSSMLDDTKPAGGRAQLASLFNTCGPIVSDGDGWMLHDYVSDDFMGLVQYNNPQSTTRGVRQTCATLLDDATGATPLARLVNITRARAGTGRCINDPSDGSGAKTIAWEEHLRLLADESNPHRAWPYQQCVDGSGHDQTCKKTAGCLFSERYASPALFAQLCTALFGTTSEITNAAVESNSITYGDNHTAGTNILFINGELDPFSWGSVTQNTTGALARNVVALVVKGGSHCADMGPPSQSDSPPMAAAKAAKNGWLRRVLGIAQN